jgi:CRP/FNR family transcriptional regulator, cyclic AMP receptor protein
VATTASFTRFCVIVHTPPVTVEAFLGALPAEEAETLRAAGVQRAYGANVTLIHQADEGGPVVLLLEGRVKIAVSTKSGRHAMVAIRGPGDLIGELAAIDDSPRSTMVTTLEPVEALVVPRSEFAALLEEHPRMALAILRIVARRLRYADAQQAQFATHDVVGRLAHRLMELSERFGTPGEDGIEITMPLSQEELAGWVGASREAVSKAFHLLRSLQIVETGRRRVTVLDREGLARQANV